MGRFILGGTGDDGWYEPLLFGADYSMEVGDLVGGKYMIKRKPTQSLLVCFSGLAS